MYCQKKGKLKLSFSVVVIYLKVVNMKIADYL
jgi:hypothetical protein